jgi:hypothetical protein
MTLNFRRAIVVIAATALVYAFVGCATNDANGRVRHGLEIEVDKSLGRATNIRYTYGDEMVDQSRPIAIAIGAFVTYIASMRVPEEFRISWETLGGIKHEAIVPIRDSIRGSIENKNIVFVIMQDRVEGYVGVTTPYGQKRQRFY